MLRTFLACLLALTLASTVHATPVRIKDLVEFDGVRGNDLVGYGLVVGLNGSGDGLRNAPFTEEIMQNMLERLGVNVTGEQFRPKNVAAVFVTATLPPFARAGSQIDVTVSAIGDAKSLLGGTLVMTPLTAADGQIYAVAQGTIIAGGASAEGEGATVTQGVPTAGTVPSGARVEREVPFDFTQLRSIRLALRTQDFTTAGRIEAAINASFGRPIARMLDAGTVKVTARPLDDTAFALDHFQRKLFPIARSLHTATARLMAEQRVAVMSGFVADLLAEIDAPAPKG